jgi:nucleoid-associated protein YgaU
MQTMPAKTRTALTIGAILLGLAIVGGSALYAANRGKTPTAQTDTNPSQAVAGTQTQQPTKTGPLDGAMSPADTGATPTGTTGTHSDGPVIAAPTGGAAGSAADGAAMAPADTGNTAPAIAGTDVPETYTVAAGDSLRGIAMKYYGDALYSADIEQFNQLSDPDQITVGQVLKMPPVADVNKQ